MSAGSLRNRHNLRYTGVPKSASAGMEFCLLPNSTKPYIAFIIFCLFFVLKGLHLEFKKIFKQNRNTFNLTNKFEMLQAICGATMVAGTFFGNLYFNPLWAGGRISPPFSLRVVKGD